MPVASSAAVRDRQASILAEADMSRVQLALNVTDIDQAVSFYTVLSGYLHPVAP